MVAGLWSVWGVEDEMRWFLSMSTSWGRWDLFCDKHNRREFDSPF